MSQPHRLSKKAYDYDGNRRIPVRCNYIVNSVDRVVANVNQITRFTINLTPNITDIRELKLETVVFPFLWNNVVPEYGNSLHIHFVSIHGVQNIVINFSTGFYTMDQLIAIINGYLSAYFASLPIPTNPFTFAVNPLSSHIDLLYDDSDWGSPATVVFNLNWAPIQSTSFHIYRMLGLSPTDVSQNTFVFSGYGTQSFPLAAENALPISYIIINIEEVPASVLTTGGKAGTWYVNISEAVVGGKRALAPLQYKAYNDYYNTVFIKNANFDMKQLNITLTDSRGYTLENQNPKEWSFGFSYVKYYES